MLQASRMSPYFLSCDWGTSHFRLRLVDRSDLTVQAEIKTAEGAAHLSPQTDLEDRAAIFAQTLGRHIAAIFEETGRTATTCVISGMASSSIGWIALPYAVVPIPLDPGHFVKHVLTLPVGAIPVQAILISGVRTNDDVMRGEECELYGLLELHPELKASNACVLLPGTHSKHVHLRDGRLESFLTYMTGEIFTHLRGMPTLKAALADGEEIFLPEFHQGVRAAQQFGLLAGLFKIRTRALLGPTENLRARSFLSGLLIGSELVDLRVPEDGKMFLAGSPALHPLYIQAGDQVGRPLLSIPPAILQQSLLHAHRRLLPP